MNWIRNVSLVLVAFVGVFVAEARADDLERRASWTPPTTAEVKATLEAWLNAQQLSENVRLQLETLWPADAAFTGIELLENVVATIAVVDPQTLPLVELCRGEFKSPLAPEFPFLEDESLPVVVRSNLRLYYGRWLAQHDMADEAQALLADLKVADVVDPASLLFYQSVVYHRLLEKEKCLASVEKLLENASAIPRRYEAVVQLMEADIRPLKVDSLDEVARLMSDIQRRLEFARAGTKVRKVEDDVVAKLDKMIEELEKQQQQQQQQSGSAGGSSPSSPMQDSQIGGANGPGNVDPKQLGKGAGWGNLPPRERQEALQQISKELPAHFREVIEEYFRKIAQDNP